MKNARQIAFGFVIFFIIDRMSRLISAIVADKQSLSELQTEKIRCSIEIGTLLVAFWLLKEKRAF
jgi:hypothetical protein